MSCRVVLCCIVSCCFLCFVLLCCIMCCSVLSGWVVYTVLFAFCFVMLCAVWRLFVGLKCRPTAFHLRVAGVEAQDNDPGASLCDSGLAA